MHRSKMNPGALPPSTRHDPAQGKEIFGSVAAPALLGPLFGPSLAQKPPSGHGGHTPETNSLSIAMALFVAVSILAVVATLFFQRVRQRQDEATERRQRRINDFFIAAHTDVGAETLAASGRVLGLSLSMAVKLEVIWIVLLNAAPDPAWDYAPLFNALATDDRGWREALTASFKRFFREMRNGFLPVDYEVAIFFTVIFRHSTGLFSLGITLPTDAHVNFYDFAKFFFRTLSHDGEYCLNLDYSFFSAPPNQIYTDFVSDVYDAAPWLDSLYIESCFVYYLSRRAPLTSYTWMTEDDIPRITKVRLGERLLNMRRNNLIDQDYYSQVLHLFPDATDLRADLYTSLNKSKTNATVPTKTSVCQHLSWRSSLSLPGRLAPPPCVEVNAFQPISQASSKLLMSTSRQLKFASEPRSSERSNSCANGDPRLRTQCSDQG
ncbi:hypothetical protein SELMODRAFT_402117 [Selaginella moellendorffii]|uniref:Uncharacterized protein n=1 Tax=Selaginella moellendorffii TaxID=88036 RepID=D8QPM8_SELML|nr:hypothetical protein SELMODRAFT_402117 [Selaginella moellendorffii]